MNKVWVHDMQILYFSELFMNFRRVFHIIISEYKLISFFGGLPTILRYRSESEGCHHYYIGVSSSFFQKQKLLFFTKGFHTWQCMCEGVGKDSGNMGHKHVCIHIVTCMLI